MAWGSGLIPQEVGCFCERIRLWWRTKGGTPRECDIWLCGSKPEPEARFCLKVYWRDEARPLEARAEERFWPSYRKRIPAPNWTPSQILRQEGGQSAQHQPALKPGHASTLREGVGMPSRQAQRLGLGRAVTQLPPPLPGPLVFPQAGKWGAEGRCSAQGGHQVPGCRAG